MPDLGTAEEERTYVARSRADFEAALEIIWPHGDYLDMDGVTLWRGMVRVSKSVHFFFASPDDDARHRIKLTFSGRRLIATHDVKAYVGDRKYEKIVQKERKPAKVLAMLNGMPPVYGMLAKERGYLKYDFMFQRDGGIDDYRLDIGIDKVEALSPDDERIRSESLYYVEFDGHRTGGEKIFCDSGFFASQLSESLIRATAEHTKASFAREYFTMPRQLRWQTYQQLLDSYAAWARTDFTELATA